MKLCIVAGEASGDLHAAEVVRELKSMEPGLELFGIGGDWLAAEGVSLLHHAREMGIVGLFNVLRHLGMFRRIYRELIEAIKRERPDLVLLVDYPDFNLRVAKDCRKLGIPVAYYISPQLWAWRQGRVRHIARYVDRMIVIFPFEETLYRKHRVPVSYVGHPLIDELADVERRPKAKPAEGEPLRLALMPGSRRGEVSSLLPPMLDAVEVLRRERPVDAFIIQAPTIHRQELLAQTGGRDVRILAHDGGAALAAAHVALSSSGTATLESAVLGTPAVIMYRLSPLTYLAAKRLVALPRFGLVNIVAGEPVVPELIQDDVNGARIAAEVRSLLERYSEVQAGLDRVRARLGGRGASRRAAEEIHKMLASV